MEQSTTEQKDRLHLSFIAALELLDLEDREPDRWEEECLSYALGAMACGLYPAAEVELAAFGRPASERPFDEIAALETKPSRFTKDMLRHGLKYVINRSLESKPSMTDMPLTNHLAVRSFLGASL